MAEESSWYCLVSRRYGLLRPVSHGQRIGKSSTHICAQYHLGVIAVKGYVYISPCVYYIGHPVDDMSVPLAAAGTAPQSGLLDLERELICSVSIAQK